MVSISGMRAVRDRAKGSGEIDLKSERVFMAGGFADHEEGSFLRSIAVRLGVNVLHFASVKHIKDGDCGYRPDDSLHGHPCDRFVIVSTDECPAFRITLLCSESCWESSLEEPVAVLHAAE